MSEWVNVRKRERRSLFKPYAKMFVEITSAVGTNTERDEVYVLCVRASMRTRESDWNEHKEANAPGRV